MFIFKILEDLCSIRQSNQTKNTFADTVYSSLVVKKSCKNMERYA